MSSTAPTPEEAIRGIARDLLASLGFRAEVTMRGSVEGPEPLICHIATDDAPLLIGRHGATLEDLQHVVRVLVGKALGDKHAPRFVVDVNDYRKERWEEIAALAEEAADLACETGQEVELPPMNAFERRIVHLVLDEDKEVVTESEGEGEERRVIVTARQKQ